MDPALKAGHPLQRSVIRRLKEWRKDQWRATLESLDVEDQSLWRMTKRITPWSHQGESLSQILRRPKPLLTI
jgi:hypothetical protein